MDKNHRDPDNQNKIPEKKDPNPTDHPSEKKPIIKIPDTRPGKDNPRNPKEDAVKQF